MRYNILPYFRQDLVKVDQTDVSGNFRHYVLSELSPQLPQIFCVSRVLFEVFDIAYFTLLSVTSYSHFI